MSRDRVSWDWNDPEDDPPPPPDAGRQYRASAKKIADFYASRSPGYQQYNRSVRGLEMDERGPMRSGDPEDPPPPPARPPSGA